MILKDFAALDGVYKLHGDPDPAGLMGRVLKRAEMRPDLGRMSAVITLTKEVEDRSGDVVVVKGIDLSDHRRHPLALFNHDKDAPIGRFEDPAGNYTVTAHGDTLRGELFFNQKSAFAHDVFECVVDKTFTAASIGFLPVAGAVQKRHPRGTEYQRSRLIEGSLVTIGDNPHAGVEAVYKALGRANASDVFRQYLMPLVPARPAAVVSGWVGGATDSTTVTKAMPNPNDTMQGGAAVDDTQPQDPNAQQDPSAAGGGSHAETIKQNLGEIAVSAIGEVVDGQMDEKTCLQHIAHALRTMRKMTAHAGGGAPGEDDEDLSDDAGADEDSDEIEEGDEFADDDEADYEDEDGGDGKPPKKKYVLAYRKKSVEAGAALYHLATADVQEALGTYRDLLGRALAFVRKGGTIGPNTFGKEVERADAAVQKFLDKRDAVVEDGVAAFGPIKKAVGLGMVTKAAPLRPVVPEDLPIPENELDQLVATFEGLATAAESQEARLRQAAG
jgi:HK97 family phage prohead protease